MNHKLIEQSNRMLLLFRDMSMGLESIWCKVLVNALFQLWERNKRESEEAWNFTRTRVGHTRLKNSQALDLNHAFRYSTGGHSDPPRPIVQVQQFIE